MNFVLVGGTALYNPTYSEDLSRISCFCRSAEMDFQRLAGPRNVSVELKYVTVFRKTNRSARKLNIPYMRKYAFDHKDANKNKRKEAYFTRGRSVGLASNSDCSIFARHKGNKAIKKKIVFLAGWLVFLNTLTYDVLCLRVFVYSIPA